MKSVTVSVIFAGLMMYVGTYSASDGPRHEPAYATFSVQFPPLAHEPDDEEEDRIMRRKKKETTNA